MVLMPQSTADLVKLLDLEPIESNLFRGQQPETRLQRAFGGQVLAQALVAAARTVDSDRLLHSMHGYFLRPGRTDQPIIYDVELVRDGGSFSARRAVARQSGKVIFFLSASFHVDEPGFEHQDQMPTDVPAPEDCPSLQQVLEKVSGRRAAAMEAEWGALEVRYAGDSREGGELVDPRHPARARVWLRSADRLSDELLLHQTVLAYASDLTLLGASVVPHEAFIGSPTLQAASVDHAMWFHRPLRADEWLLYDQISPSATAGLGLSTGRLFQGGRLVTSVAQEGLIRDVSNR